MHQCTHLGNLPHLRFRILQGYLLRWVSLQSPGPHSKAEKSRFGYAATWKANLICAFASFGGILFGRDCLAVSRATQEGANIEPVRVEYAAKWKAYLICAFASFDGILFGRVYLTVSRATKLG